MKFIKLKIKKEYKSASFDVEAISFGNHTDAWPAVSFHLVVVLQAVEIGNHV